MTASAPTLVTGAAGFIGFAVARRLLELGRPVVGVDNFAPYYDRALKEARLRVLEAQPLFRFERLDLADSDAGNRLFGTHRPALVIHLAAEPGVRYSLENPRAYIDANLVAFANLLESCRHGAVKHLTYASSSSVYGLNRKMPFSVHDNVDHPVSLYAATKKANELMAHSYSHLFGLPATGLRFFTVYGPWGRPDMAVYAFTDAIATGRPIEVSNAGRVWRDFTYVDDIVEGLARLIQRPPDADSDWNARDRVPDPATSLAPHRVYNIGNDNPEELNHLIAVIEDAVGRKAVRIERLLPPGDVLETR
ncbi:MAG: NAD-dependent epimerase/dehydratase family protein, partial [Microvirga sp.]